MQEVAWIEKTKSKSCLNKRPTGDPTRLASRPTSERDCPRSEVKASGRKLAYLACIVIGLHLLLDLIEKCKFS